MPRSVPVISIGQSHQPQTLRQLDLACREWGFFQVVDHGIDPALIAGLQREMRCFFDQPIAAKRAIARSAANPWGFFDRELTQNTRDWKQVFDYGPQHCLEQGPDQGADQGADQGIEWQPQWPRRCRSSRRRCCGCCRRSRSTWACRPRP